MTSWIVPCNLKYYDVVGAFNDLNTLDWKQSSKNIQTGDLIFIYVSSPVQAIKYLCKVNKANLHSRDIDDSKYRIVEEKYVSAPMQMEIQLLHKFDNELTMNFLTKMGVKGRIQRTRRMDPLLNTYIFENILADSTYNSDVKK